MATRRVKYCDELKRLITYLEGKPKLVHRYLQFAGKSTIRADTDANLTGDTATRKNTSGAVITLGPHWAKSHSEPPTPIARAPAGSELQAPVKATTEPLGVQAMAKDFEQHIEVRVMVDAPAAVGTISRRGLGKAMHLDIDHLWVQWAAAKKRAKSEKTPGTANPADMVTETLAQAEVERHIGPIGACHA